MVKKEVKKETAKTGYSSSEETRQHPEQYNECQYSGEWGDCDPFKMIRIKEERLISGGASCPDRKNITKPCSRDDFPPGTVWLLQQHKNCVLELQKLKAMIEDLHRYIDLIHQRGQALYNSYNELRKRLMDIRREITIIGRRNHDAEQTINRLRKEVEDWKAKSNKMQMELNQVKAQYKSMEIKVRASRTKYEELTKSKEEITNEQNRHNIKLDELTNENRNLKASLLDTERYKEELRELTTEIAALATKIQGIRGEIKQTKEELNKCRMESAMPRGKVTGPKFNKDTKVKLDMDMWITHNITQEEGETYTPELKYGPEPGYAPPPPPPPKYEPPPPPPPPPKYEAPPPPPPPKYEEPKVEETTVPEVKYEEPPKYVEPAVEPAKY